MARDRPPPIPDEAGRAVVLDEFASDHLGNVRRVTIRLPPGYDRDAARRYPVAYLHDGQNLFEPERSAFGVSWRAGETADRLAWAGRIQPVILVGIDSVAERLSEYAPHPDPAQEVIEARANSYGRFVLEEVKPFVDRECRTLPGQAHAAVIGSSMGGLATLAMARRHPDRFALCGVLSPSLWWARGRLLEELKADRDWMRRMRVWLCMGTHEGRQRGRVSPHVERTRRLVGLFDAAGLIPGRDYYYQEVSGGEHNEAAWAARFDKVLLYLFGW
jgi:predicted alpha/beta superfamily hydrolase